ncbi:MAG: class I SAM-dependent methyltransferase [Candidatus Andersenbacteria bacterium]
MGNLVHEKIEIASSGRVVADLDKVTHEVFPVSIDPKEGVKLQRDNQEENPGTVVEIGLGYGFAALNVIAGMNLAEKSKFRLLTIDPNQKNRFANLGLQLLREVGAYRQIEFHEEPSEFVLPRLLKAGESADFAVVDGNHRFEHVFVDLFFLGSLLKPGSLIFLDDLQLPGIRKAVSFFTKNLGWKVEAESNTSVNHHWCTLRTRTKVLERKFDSFTDF